MIRKKDTKPKVIRMPHGSATPNAHHLGPAPPPLDAAPVDITLPERKEYTPLAILQRQINAIAGERAAELQRIEWADDPNTPCYFKNSPDLEQPRIFAVVLVVGSDWLRTNHPEVYAQFVLLRLAGKPDPFQPEEPSE